MKVLQINSVCGIGSTGRIAADIHNTLIDEGHESCIAYGRNEAKSCDNVIKIGGNAGVYLHVVKTRLFDRHGYGSKAATRKFIDEIKQLDPDIIHLQNIHGYYLNVKILFDYLKKADKPVVWTMHDCWSFTGHCTYFDYADCDRWKMGCYDCPQKNSYPESKLFDRSKKNYTEKKDIFTGVKNMTVVTPSVWLANLVKQSYLKDYDVQVINNGIDLDVFKPTERDCRENSNLKDKFIILGVSADWIERKGLKYFVELSGMLSDDEVIIAVGIDDALKAKLPKNIIGINRTNNVEELVELYSSADVLLNPTLEDNYPTVNLEAIACHTPVITFNTGGSPESVNGSNGIVVDNKNTESLYAAIQDIKENKDKYKINVEKSFDKRVFAQKYIELYEDIM